MKISISRVWGQDLGEYRSVLDKYNAEYNVGNTAIIEIANPEELFSLAKDLEVDLILGSNGDNSVEIYDNYIE